ncbi:hypothetical protein HS088_TW15G00980 [Tripterygium wilfordii]|uniref:Uncharacterized protein n=1 Tax=Tripterygium wilfordii TaxID=458696 RepID=A0A7J7CN32_TRIWF|nr:hypothetical protein HS088_TW15G00980 [Tripterygium wilfordii]
MTKRGIVFKQWLTKSFQPLQVATLPSEHKSINPSLFFEQVILTSNCRYLTKVSTSLKVLALSRTINFPSRHKILSTSAITATKLHIGKEICHQNSLSFSRTFTLIFIVNLKAVDKRLS